MAIAKALEPKERAAARERKAHDGRPRKLPKRRTGDTPDKVAAHTIQNRCAEIKLRAERRAGAESLRWVRPLSIEMWQVVQAATQIAFEEILLLGGDSVEPNRHKPGSVPAHHYPL